MNIQDDRFNKKNVDIIIRVNFREKAEGTFVTESPLSKFKLYYT